MRKNFVSVSAVTDIAQLREIYAIYNEEKLTFPLAIGYQVSNKSINQNTQNSRQPQFAELPVLCHETLKLGMIPAIHYYTKDNALIIDDLEKLVSKGIVPDSTLIQFNTLPPERDILKRVKQMGFNIILKVTVSNKCSSEGGYSVWKGENAEDAKRGNIIPLLDQVIKRADLIDYAMFDPSHGTNLGLDLSEESLAIRFGKSILEKRSLDHLGLVYAGGINPSNVISVTRALKSFFPERFSIDIESGVRADDRLDMGFVKAYLVNSAYAF